MLKKMLFAATMIALFTLGLAFNNQPSAASANAETPAAEAATPTAPQGATCAVPVTVTETRLIKSVPRPGIPTFRLVQSVFVKFTIGTIPQCFNLTRLTATVTIIKNDGSAQTVVRQLQPSQREITVPVGTIFQALASPPSALRAKVEAEATAAPIRGQDDKVVDID